MNDLLTVEDVQQVLRIGRARVFELFQRGELRSFRVGRRRLVPRQELDRFIGERMTAAEEGPWTPS